jgi:transposase-like protein
LQLWFYAIHLFTTTRHGVSGKELERQLGVTYKTAWRMAKLIREHMADVDGEAPIGGFSKRVEIDETFVGGVYSRGSRGGNPGENKTIVFGMMEHGGDIVTHVVPNRQRATLYPLIKASVKPHTEIHTDECTSYIGLGNVAGMSYWHKSVNHGLDQYVSPTGTTVNAIEGFWRHLKASIAGTHTSVSAKYLATYAKEFEFRFNRRNDPASMFPALVSTFRPLTPKCD